MSVDFFPCGLGLIRGCMHISSTDKKHPSCRLLALLPQLCYVLHVTFVWQSDICMYLLIFFDNSLVLICFLYMMPSQTCYQYYTTTTVNHKGRGRKQDLKLTPSPFPLAPDPVTLWWDRNCFCYFYINNTVWHHFEFKVANRSHLPSYKLFLPGPKRCVF